MISRSRIILLGLALIAVGVAAYFLDPQRSYDANANYEISHAKNGKWTSAVVSGSDLNQQAAHAKPMNAIVAVGAVAFGVLLLGFEWWRSRS